MRKSAYLAGASALAVTLSLGLSPGAARAADADAPATVEEVVVTGSFIKGTPEDAALPVDVIGAEEIQKQGAPSTLDLIKSLSVSSGVLGDTNQFDARAQGSEGSGSVNLRGLGPQRTLVLLNGHRLAINPFGLAGGGVVDTNILPTAAIGRVEVLKDGAAATYGSDAIAGVVNFITRKNFEGLEIGGSYKYISGSDGDYTLNGVWGHNFENGNVLLTAGWQHRSQLSVQERDWANKPYTANPEGGWSAAGNPGSLLTPAFVIFRDPGCAGVGGYANFSGATPVCSWHYTPYDNLTEKEDRYQLYGEVNVDLDATTKLHVEALYSNTRVPDWQTSPSYAALATPDSAASPVAGRYFIPGSNPGLIQFVTDNPSITGVSAITGLPVTFASATLLATGAFNLSPAFRPFALGGNPLFNNGPSHGLRVYDAFRIEGDLSGEMWGGVGWNIALNYSTESGLRTGYDTLVDRYELALRGLGGPGCDPTTGVPGVGACGYFNPFAEAIQRNSITGQVNPNYNAGVANTNLALINWFFPELRTKQTSRLFTVDAILNGHLWTLPGGDVGWALGMQFRRDEFTVTYNDISNRAVNPCTATPVTGSTSCANPSGPFMFLGVGSEGVTRGRVYAGFGELQLPFTDNFNVQLAARYEDYGGAVGSTFNPKISAKWQITEDIAIRGSAGSTFRGPPSNSLNNDFITSLQSIKGTFRAVDIFGNPNLAPEKAKTYSLGIIFKHDGLKASLDWWRFDFDNPITTEPVAGIVDTFFPAALLTAGHCGDPLYAALQARFTFSGACSTTNISRLKTFTVNGAAVRTSGIDFLADWKFNDVMGGDFALGTTITYVQEYKTGATSVAGFTVAPAFDAVGLLNYQTTAYPLPRWKGSVYAEYTNGPHNLRVTVRYIDKYTDQRTAPFALNAYKDNTGASFTVPGGKVIDAYVTADATYRVFLPWSTTLTATIENMFDKDPSFARLDLNYDPFTGNALGRTFKFGLVKKF
ncbi:MAG: TonB-dependent receptor [Caulobacter sp.]|nr:TonB-dependent receptor [Caulobacter sp.]